jgi:hypothetical protein
VEERIVGDRVQTLRITPYCSGLKRTSITLFDMLGRNRMPPIAFLYDRQAAAAVDFYDESLPVLGDWDFNLRFLERYNVGVLPEPLAFYHIRAKASATAAPSEYGNTITDGMRKHEYYRMAILNRLLRQDLSGNLVNLGFLSNLAGALEDQHELLSGMTGALNRVESRLTALERTASAQGRS